ncbi:MAG: hypothetical protein QOH57_1922 [Mycobacterium sp.]|nr:hypothetical protein [Mycobacterium sp.]
MPFISDFAGPQYPVPSWPPREPGSLRRTSTIDTHAADSGEVDVDLRARDVRTAPAGAVEVGAECELRSHLSNRVIQRISATPDDRRLDRLSACLVGPGFRNVVADVLADEAGRATLLHLLLDDWPGASLVSGYAAQHALITRGAELPVGDGVADRMTGICSGFAPTSSVVSFVSRNNLMPNAPGPAAPDLIRSDPDGIHPVDPLPPHSMRRLRRLDLHPRRGESVDFDAHFRDSHVDGASVETVVHEYTVNGTVELAGRTITELTAAVHVLPWQECPGALGSAARVRGMALAELRPRIRTEFVGTSTCTHLNDTLRSLGDLDALIDLQDRDDLAAL